MLRAYKMLRVLDDILPGTFTQLDIADPAGFARCEMVLHIAEAKGTFAACQHRIGFDGGAELVDDHGGMVQFAASGPPLDLRQGPITGGQQEVARAKAPRRFARGEPPKDRSPALRHT